MTVPGLLLHPCLLGCNIKPMTAVAYDMLSRLQQGLYISHLYCAAACWQQKAARARVDCTNESHDYWALRR